MVGRERLELSTICARNFCVCQADILTRLDDRPKAFGEFGGREIKATGGVGWEPRRRDLYRFTGGCETQIRVCLWFKQGSRYRWPNFTIGLCGLINSFGLPQWLTDVGESLRAV